MSHKRFKAGSRSVHVEYQLPGTKTCVIVHRDRELDILVIWSVNNLIVIWFCTEYVSGNLSGSVFLGCK